MVALIDDPAVIQRVFRHLDLSTEVPEALPARVPAVFLVGDAPPTL